MVQINLSANRTNINDHPELQKITQQLINQYTPEKLILFGSYAKNTFTQKSDIDLCIITDTEDKRKTLTDMYLNIKSDKPFDLLLYTSKEWNSNITDQTSFAHKINKEGIMLYG